MAKKEGNSLNIKKGRKNRLLVYTLILTLIIGIVLAIVLNIGNIRDKLLGMVGFEDAGETASQKTPEQIALEQEKEFINNEKKKLDVLRSSLEELKQKLDAREDEISQREAAIFVQQKEIEELEEKLSLQYKNLQDLIDIYEKMDSEQAAAILSQISDQNQVIQIFRNMKKEIAAEILGLMDPKKAAEILSKMQ